MGRALIDEPALIEALRKGWLAGAGAGLFAREPVRNSPWLDAVNAPDFPSAGARRRGLGSRLAGGHAPALGRP